MESAKLTFTGDIMAGAEIDRKFHRDDNSFDYSPYFENCSKLFAGSDYVIGNLETPLAGEAAGYSSATYCFNTPLEFARAIKKAGIKLINTANNHCMDRDYSGLLATLKNLDELDLPHVGTSCSMAERENGVIVNINGIKFGFSAYTYGTNAFAHHLYLPEEAKFAVNLLQPEEELPGAIHLLNSNLEIGRAVSRIYRPDNALFQQHIAPLQRQMVKEWLQLRHRGAEIIIMLLHSGGQYNIDLDPFTERVVEFITGSGLVDLVIGNHPHVPQIGKLVNNVPVAFSLGNFAYHPRIEPDNRRNLAEYSLLPTAEFTRDQTGKARFKNMKFRITKSVNCSDKFTRVMDSSMLSEQLSGRELTKLQNDLRQVATRAKGVASDEIELTAIYDWL